VALDTGARPNEWLALRWSDISFTANALSIRRSLYWPLGGGWIFTKPKTQRSNRTITIAVEVVEALRQHKHAQLMARMKRKHYQDHDLVFATEDGTPMSWRNFSRRILKPLLLKAGLPDMALYSLRHTSASLQVAAGVPFRVIAERLGTSTTMIDVTYSHVPQTLQRDASDRLSRLLYAYA
jgi:integrase